jgi:hypothetical protein
MKTTRPTYQPRQTTHRPLRPALRTVRPPHDPLQKAALARRLHTDFLALAFYPGMGNVREHGRPQGRTHAA